MTTLLVPVDGSDCSERAVRYALARMRASQDSIALHLLNVQAPLASVNVKLLVSQRTLDTHYREEGEKALRSGEALVKQSGLSAIPHIGVGDAAQIILDYARELSADEIVMGTHGRGVLAGSVMGSVAQKVVHRTALPVVLVH